MIDLARELRSQSGQEFHTYVHRQLLKRTANAITSLLAQRDVAIAEAEEAAKLVGLNRSRFVADVNRSELIIAAATERYMQTIQLVRRVLCKSLKPNRENAK